MTGAQNHPGTGSTLAMIRPSWWTSRNWANRSVLRGSRCQPLPSERTGKVVSEEMTANEPSLIIADAPCVLLKTGRILADKPLILDEDTCKGCRACILTGCPALEWVKIEEAGEGEKRKGHSRINPTLCVGCGVCQEVCKFGSIEEAAHE